MFILNPKNPKQTVTIKSIEIIEETKLKVSHRPMKLLSVIITYYRNKITFF